MSNLAFAQVQPCGQGMNINQNSAGGDDANTSQYNLLISLAQLDLELARNATAVGVAADLLFDWNDKIR